MAILEIKYNQLSKAQGYADKAAKSLDMYVSNINKSISTKIGNISGGQSSTTKEALAQRKKR